VTTYCYHLRESIDEQYPSIESILVQDSGSRCPIQIKVELAPKRTKTDTVDIKYTAVLDTSNMNPAFKFTGSIAKTEVPSYAIATSRDESRGKEYDFPIANIVICDWGKCDLFNMGAEGNGNIYTSDNNPNDFGINKEIALGSQQIIIPKDGKYTGLARLAINLAPNQRLDFVTFFPVQIGEPAGEDPIGIFTDGETTYCWTSKADIFEESIESRKILITRTGNNCPGTMRMMVSKKEVEINEKFSIEYTFQPNIQEDTSNMIASISSTNAIKDPESTSYYVVPVSVVATCPAGPSEKCSTYSSLDSSTIDVKDFGGRNFTNGYTKYLATQSFTQSGEYRIISRVAMQTTEGERIDFAVYNKVTVNDPAQTTNMNTTTFLYIGLAIGVVILLVGFLFCVCKKRKTKKELKKLPFSSPRFDPSTNRSSNFSAYSKSPHHSIGTDSMEFSNVAWRNHADSISSGGQYHQQQHEKDEYNSHESTSTNNFYGEYPSKKQAPISDAKAIERNDLLSLNSEENVMRRTFESERTYDIYDNRTSNFSRESPSVTMSDLDSEWEFNKNTNSSRTSNTTTYSAYNDLTRSTYRANTEGFVVLEENPAHVDRVGADVDIHPTNDPSSRSRYTTSSEWTVGTRPTNDPSRYTTSSEWTIGTRPTDEPLRHISSYTSSEWTVGTRPTNDPSRYTTSSEWTVGTRPTDDHTSSSEWTVGNRPTDDPLRYTINSERTVGTRPSDDPPRYTINSERTVGTRPSDDPPRYTTSSERTVGTRPSDDPGHNTSSKSRKSFSIYY
jgi:hypothetical protein